MQPIRVFFKKAGKAKYISHLDLTRAVTRALLRSGLPIYYTEGFNPHPKLVFALPLSIFQESEYEIFDFALTESYSFSEASKKLSAAMPKELEIVKVAPPLKKLKELKYARYTLTVECLKSAAEVEDALKGEVIVTKKTKTRTEDTDISKQILSVSVSEEGGKLRLDAVLSAGANEYLNPQYLINYLGDSVKESSIKRTALLDADLTLLV